METEQKTKCPHCKSEEVVKCGAFELATDVKLNNPNKWVELIQLSTQSN